MAKIKSKGLKKAVAKLENKFNLLTNRTDINSGVALYLESSTKLRFKSQKSPSGERWLPLQSFRRAKEGQKLDLNPKPLIDSGRLRNTIESNFDLKSIRVGTRQTAKNGFVYGAAHQFGTRKGVPERPFLGLSAKDRLEIVNIIKLKLSK